MDLSLQNKNVLVCGSTSGIGKAAAEELAALGARVILLARNPEKLKKVCSNLPALPGVKHLWKMADFDRPDEVQDVIRELTEEDGLTIHVLVNNTGGPPAGLAIDADTKEFVTAFERHLICNHILVQHVVPGMKKAGFGRIINVISTSVKNPLPNLGVSNTVRGAVANWSKTLANELGQFNITVNNVLPGPTRTPRLNQIAEKRASTGTISVEEAFEAMSHDVPMGRIAEPEELGAAIAFLASPAASFINGINLPVDGGRLGCL